ncbi:MAG TPA: tRNA preQ1(34) S-adenosylmethionine ribosyltransferase-isomerase QueA [Abditibacteriaceae bacterium]|nr:tRNA preQ1(34) S-adenosylmethionine ribosyltransferase-isomerase QueA [Abditibacteriaceae bacterium]
MLTAELEYSLPQELIAQEPAEPRDQSRLMLLRRTGGAVEHHRFEELPNLLRRDDLLIFNDTRVLHARLNGRKESGGRVEALLLREIAANVWQALLKPSARLRPGAKIRFASSDGATAVEAEPLARSDEIWTLRFHASADVRTLLPSLGEIPLPHYIKKTLADESRYQTVFASRTVNGQAALDSAAAPTAGLHFTPALFEALGKRGIRHAFITLGVGIATFRPVQTATLEEHVMHAEEFVITDATAHAINEQRQRGGRVVAVGTTTTRVLETVADEAGCVPAIFGSTSIFIRPGYRFRCVDALLTNFHLPRSTLLAMVAAFAESGTYDGLSGLQKIRCAYHQAIEAKYRFFSFGDAMLIE